LLHEALWRHGLNEAPHSGWNGLAHAGKCRVSGRSGIKAAIPRVIKSADKKELEPVTPSSTVTLNPPTAALTAAVG
jgi:hypothetical protein